MLKMPTVNVYLLETIDPVHIGAGGYRLDYIDNVIVRNYDTTPKIPGSSLSGVARQYLARSQADEKSGANCGGNNSRCDNGDCIVCKTFGIAKDSDSRKGSVQFSDALLLFFPVATLAGPVWITTAERLQDLTQVCKESAISEIIVEEMDRIPAEIEGHKYFVAQGKVPFLELNGFIYELARDNTKPIKVLIPPEFKRPLVVISEKAFIQTVKRNLEVRTSVAINPSTGTAEDKALFTFEAIPRASYLYFPVVINIPDVLEGTKVQDIEEALELGMQSYSITGIGGMTTRGFGRVRFVKLNATQEWDD